MTLSDNQDEQMMRRVNQNRIHKTKYQMQMVNNCSLQKGMSLNSEPQNGKYLGQEVKT